jgi:hypothetical protein
MLSLALASLLAAAPAGEPWPVTLRPAFVVEVQTEEAAEAQAPESAPQVSAQAPKTPKVAVKKAVVKKAPARKERRAR